MKRWITIKEYAELWGITRAAVSLRIKRGSIPPERIKRNDANRIIIMVDNDDD